MTSLILRSVFLKNSFGLAFRVLRASFTSEALSSLKHKSIPNTGILNGNISNINKSTLKFESVKDFNSQAKIIIQIHKNNEELPGTLSDRIWDLIHNMIAAGEPDNDMISDVIYIALDLKITIPKQVKKLNDIIKFLDEKNRQFDDDLIIRIFEKVKYVRSSYILQTLVRVYSRNEIKPDAALKTFHDYLDNVTIPKIEPFDSLISMYLLQNNFKSVIQLYNMIVQFDIAPSSETYHSIIKALVMEGKIEECQKLLSRMRDLKKLETGHYSTFISSLPAGGNRYNIIHVVAREMKILRLKPDAILLQNIILEAVFHGDIEDAEIFKDMHLKLKGIL